MSHCNRIGIQTRKTGQTFNFRGDNGIQSGNMVSCGYGTFGHPNEIHLIRNVALIIIYKSCY